MWLGEPSVAAMYGRRGVRRARKCGLGRRDGDATSGENGAPRELRQRLENSQAHQRRPHALIKLGELPSNVEQLRACGGMKMGRKWRFGIPLEERSALANTYFCRFISEAKVL